MYAACGVGLATRQEVMWGGMPGAAGGAEALLVVDLQGHEGAVADGLRAAAGRGVQHLHGVA